MMHTSDPWRLGFFFSKKDLEESVIITDSAIIEMVSPSDSCNPVFRDDFLYLCERLRAFTHPSLPVLIDSGEAQGRLYRVWQGRPLRPLTQVMTRRPGNKVVLHALLHWLDGISAMRVLGLPLAPDLIRFLSLDSEGIFLARLPFTLKSRFPSRENYHALFDVFSTCPDELAARSNKGLALAPHTVFQFQLGTLIWAAWSGQLPFREPPALVSQRGGQFERQLFDFGPLLTPVLLRMTKPESRKRFPTLTAALQALKPAFEQALQYRGG